MSKDRNLLFYVLAILFVCSVVAALIIILQRDKLFVFRSQAAQRVKATIPINSKLPINTKSASQTQTKKTKPSRLFSSQDNCNYRSRAFVFEVVNNNGVVSQRPLLHIPEIAIESTIRYDNGEPLYERPFIMAIEKDTGASKKIDVELPKPQQEAGFADVKLTMSDRVGKRFKIVDQFCTPLNSDGSGNGCPSTLEKTDTIKGFRINCDSNIEYGWIVQREPYTLIGRAEVSGKMSDYPGGFGVHFKTEICDKHDIKGGDCAQFIGEPGSIYGGKNYELEVTPAQPYEIEVNYNLNRFLDNFQTSPSSETRRQTVSFNSFSQNQLVGLPADWVVTYTGCQNWPRPTPRPAGSAIEPYRCQLDVDEVDGFVNTIDILAGPSR